MLRATPRRAAIVLALAGLAASVSSSPGPALAQKVSDPDLFDKSLEVAWRAVEQYGLYDDPEQLQRVADIGYRVALESGYDRFPFTFHLADMPEPNAFALPGGHIFVTRGMLEMGLTDDMLAALLGHEVAHVVEEHYRQTKKKATLLQIASQVLVAGVLVAANNSSDRRGPTDPRFGNNDRTGDLVQGAAAASLVVTELLLRSYSRENEAESDLQGQRWAAAAGFDPLGAADLMRLMQRRIPQEKRYGYWMTHPFFDDRIRAAEANGKLIKRLEGHPPEAFRTATQSTLLAYLDEGRVKEKGAIALVKDQALIAWPKGPTAERLRLEKLHGIRDEELARIPVARDFGRLIRRYKEEQETVRVLDSETRFHQTLAEEINAFERQREDLYPKARAVFVEGVFETPFLETFLSNYPEAMEAPRAALALADAMSRLGNQTEAVRFYLRAWEAGPDSEAGQRAARGLKVLAPRLESLAALQQLSLQERDDELAALAQERLTQTARGFEDIENGAEYLRRFPDGPFVNPVIERVNTLADSLLAEVVLYQALGDAGKAIERINKILTAAPTSAAAEHLRDQAVFES
jgi:Zn-dependent protease with chaperone function